MLRKASEDLYTRALSNTFQICFFGVTIPYISRKLPSHCPSAVPQWGPIVCSIFTTGADLVTTH